MHIKTILLTIFITFSCLADTNVVNFNTPHKIHVKFIKLPKFNSVSVVGILKDSGTANFAPGVIELLAHALEMCESSKPGEQSFAQVMSENCFTFSASPSKDEMILSLTFLKTQLEEAATFLKNRIYNITFNDFEEAKSDLSSTLKLGSNTPRIAFSEAIDKSLFPGHRYGLVLSDAILKSVTKASVTEVYKNLFNKQDLTVIIAGDLTRDEVNSFVDKVFANIKPAPHKKVGNVKDVKTQRNKEKILNSFKSPHYKVLLYFPNVATNTQDPKLVAAHMILNHFTSGNTNYGIYKILRDSGLVYNARLVFNAYKHGGYLGLIIYTDKYAKSKQKAVAFLKKLAARGISESDLSDEKAFLKSKIVSSLKTPSDHAEHVKTLTLYGIKFENEHVLLKALDSIDLKYFNKFLRETLKCNEISVVAIH